GAGLGIAILGTVLSVGYRVALPGVPPGADRSLSAAVEIARMLAPAQAGDLLRAAHGAFQSGLSAALAGAAGLLWLTAAAAAVMLRDRPEGAGPAG
ncbi:MFS transporter, partial [Spongiactinospora gelatinilytica]